MLPPLRARQRRRGDLARLSSVRRQRPEPRPRAASPVGQRRRSGRTKAQAEPHGPLQGALPCRRESGATTRPALRVRRAGAEAEEADDTYLRERGGPCAGVPQVRMLDESGIRVALHVQAGDAVSSGFWLPGGGDSGPILEGLRVLRLRGGGRAVRGDVAEWFRARPQAGACDLEVEIDGDVQWH